MIPYLGCEIARELLPAFVDGELSVDDQVAVEAHLRWCRTCAARVEDLRIIGDSLRLVATNVIKDNAPELAGIHAGVLSRIRAEREHSFDAQVRGLFDDLHLLWAAVGAVTAVLVCLLATMGVLHAVVGRPDSLAGVIHLLANPGPDRNQVRLDEAASVPRELGMSTALEHLPEDEAVFALAAVVTREGRFANYELLLPEDEAVFALANVVTRAGRIADYELLVSEHNRARRQTRAPHADDVTALLDAVSRSRFQPAQTVGRTPVTVNMVWLLARTTVKGTARALDFSGPQSWREHELLPAAPARPKPLDLTPSGHPAPRRSTTA